MSSPVSPRGTSSTPRLPKPRLISELNYAVLKKLSDRLDMPGEGNWRKLISVLPGGCGEGCGVVCGEGDCEVCVWCVCDYLQIRNH